MNHPYANARGATLVELLSSTLLVSLLMAMSYSFARAALMSARVQEVKSEAQEVTIIAVDMLVRELRMAGFSAAGQPVVAVRAAGRDEITVAADINGDGDAEDTNELIGYRYSEEKHQLTRATGGGSPQPFVRNVPIDGFQLSFFDASGAEIAPGPQGMPLERRRQIRRIDVRLRVELTNPDPRATAPLTSTVSSSVLLRNQ